MVRVITKRFGKVCADGTSLSVPMLNEILNAGLDVGSGVEITLGIMNNDKVIFIKKRDKVVVRGNGGE